MAQVISNYDQIGRLVGTATANQAIRRNSANNAWEFFEPASRLDVGPMHHGLYCPGALSSVINLIASPWTVYNGTDGALTASRLYVLPFYIDRPLTIVSLAIMQATNGSAGQVYRMGLFTGGNGVPTTVLSDGGTVAADAGGAVMKSITINYSVTRPMIVWMGVTTDSGGTVQRTGGTSYGFSSGNDGNRNYPYQSSVSPGSSLDTFSATAFTFTGSSFPRMYIGVS